MKVKNDSSCKGNIRKNPFTGQYQYTGAVNVNRPSVEEANLEDLLYQIEDMDM